MYESYKTTRRYRRRDSVKLRASEDGSPLTTVVTLPTAQFTVSEGHPWASRQRGDLNDIGGNFFTASTRITDGNFRNFYTGGVTPPGRQFIGNQYPRGAYDGLAVIDSEMRANTFDAYARNNGFCANISQLDAKGATAIARCSPTQQYASAFAGIKEAMKDGLPKIPGVSQARIEGSLRDFEIKKKQGLIKGSADEYLNIVFGWSPLLSDVASIYNSVKNWEKMVGQFQRDAGRIVHRGYRYPDERSTVRTNMDPFSSGGSVYPGMSSWNREPVSYPVTSIKDSVNVRKTWFSGAFTYYIPSGDSHVAKLRRKSQELDQMLGLSLTPESLWNATPWTWFIDWFVNAGDVITNISNMLDDGLVMHYGYVMERSIWTSSYTFSQIPIRGQAGSRTSSLEYKLDIKQRRRATPFGFGLNSTSFSKKQLAILAALGITRV